MKIDNLILLEYQKLLEDSKVEDLKKKRKELQDQLDATPNPDRDPGLTKKRSALKDQISDLSKQIGDSSSDTDEDEDENPEENIKKFNKNIEAERENIAKAMTRIQELNKKKKTSTDPSVEDKEIAKEKTKIDQSNEDIREMKAQKDKERKKLDSDSIKKEPSSEPTDKPVSTKKEPEDKSEPSSKTEPESTDSEESSDEDSKKSKQEEIDKLSEEIESLKEKISKTTDAKNDAISEIRKRTDELASNKLLQAFVRKERLRGIIAFNEKVLSMMTNDKQKTDIDERLKKLKEEESEISSTLEKATKKADEKNKDDEKYIEAKKKSEDPESGDSTEDQPEDSKKPETSNVSKSEPETSKVTKSEPETSKITKSEDPKDIKKKEIGIKLDNLQKKLSGAKEAADKASDSNNDKAFDAIMKNVEDLENAIDDLRKEKANLGESFDEIDAKIWAIEWMVENILHQINNRLYLIND
jgi:chromosome segregation ATPase